MEMKCEVELMGSTSGYTLYRCLTHGCRWTVTTSGGWSGPCPIAVGLSQTGTIDRGSFITYLDEADKVTDEADTLRVERLEAAIDQIRAICDGLHEPNEETKAAIDEAMRRG